MTPIALSCGDPAGIGTEIALKAWEQLGGALPFYWIGDPRHLPRGAPHVRIGEPWEAVDAARRAMPVLEVPFPRKAELGVLDPRNAPGVVAAIDRAVADARAGRAGAVCTLPIHKQILMDGAGFAFPGHTEYLAHLAGDVPVAMMLASPELRVVPVTIHIPLSEVPGALTQERVESAIRLARETMIRDFGVARPRIAVAGLNPHAGEGGRIGREEEDVIAPALARLRAEGFAIDGPRSADTMFHAKARRGYDVAVCMYHDQALIPIKTVDFEGGVNVTLGLPFVRTSPDHGTAIDIAGKGIADPASLVAALILAEDMARTRGLS